MSGHNKWSTIKRKKGATDSKRSKIFSRIIKEINIAVRESGADPDNNPKLRLAISNAKGANMPKENVSRAVSKASDKDASNYNEVTYEGMAPNGVAIFIECATDNIQRTVANIRSYFNKHGGNLGTNGSLSFIFDRKGVFRIPKGTIDTDEFEMEVIDAGAEDIAYEDDSIVVTTEFESFGSMLKKLEEMKLEVESAELQRIPKTFVTLDKESAQKVLKLVDIFEDDDDVQSVFHNLELTDELLAEL
jgi:YebC/PmpR family DNA-binding regulatory protein